MVKIVYLKDSFYLLISTILDFWRYSHWSWGEWWRERQKSWGRSWQLFKLSRFFVGLAPLVVNPKAEVEVVILTSRADVLMSLIALRTFGRVAAFSFRVTIISDGTLSARQIALLQRQIPLAKIVNPKQLDRLILKVVGKSSPIYQHRYLPYVRKKIGMFLVAQAQKILYFDSDVVFFEEISEINRWAKTPGQAIFISDPYDSYLISAIEAKHHFGYKPLEKLNSGLVGFDRQDFDLKLLERVLLIGDEIVKNIYRPPQMQIYFALLFAKLKKAGRTVKRLPNSYVVSDQPADYKKCAVGHYVRSVRDQYFVDVARLVKRTGG